jgi:hypothetical protein
MRKTAMRRMSLLISIFLLQGGGCLQRQPPQQSNSQNPSPYVYHSPTGFYRDFDAKRLIQGTHPTATDLSASDSELEATSGSQIESKKEIEVKFIPSEEPARAFSDKNFLEQVCERVQQELQDQHMKVEASGIREEEEMQTCRVRYEKEGIEGEVGLSGRRGSQHYVLHIGLREVRQK